MLSGIASGEWRWLLLAVVFILLLSSAPVVAGYQAESPEWAFNGAVFDRRDYAVHVGSMQHGTKGNWTYQFLFSTEEGHPAFIKLSYVILGQLTRLLGIDVSSGYQWFRWIAGGPSLILIYIFMAQEFSSPALRRTGFALAAGGSGLGWLMLILGWIPDPHVSPIDFWLIDMFVFYSIATFPHFALMIGLLLLTGIGYFRFTSSRRIGHWLTAALAGLVMLPLQTFSVAIGDLIAFAALLASWWKKKRAELAGLVPLAALVGTQIPGLVYSLLLVQRDPTWRQFASQNVVLSPSPIYFVLGMGVIGPLAAWGALIAWRRRRPMGVLCTIWALGALALSYSPTLVQRRFALGLMIPLSLLATIGLSSGGLPRLRSRWPGWVRRQRGTILMLVVASSLPSTLYLAIGGAVYASSRPPELFDPVSVTSGLKWLAENAAELESVMASEPTGLLVPPLTGLRTYVGHPFETLDYQTKAALAERFFSAAGMTREERQMLLASCGCDWVFVGPYELDEQQSLFSELPSNLRLRFDRDGVRIYQVLET